MVCLVDSVFKTWSTLVELLDAPADASRRDTNSILVVKGEVGMRCWLYGLRDWITLRFTKQALSCALTLRFAHVIRAQSLLLFASPASAPQALITLTTVLIEKDALLRYTALLEQFVEVCVRMVDKDDMCGVYMSAVSCCVLPCPFDIAVFFITLHWARCISFDGKTLFVVPFRFALVDPLRFVCFVKLAPRC